MNEVPAADRLMGLELQIEELVEQQKRAAVQGRTDDVQRLEEQIEALQNELADVAEAAAGQVPRDERPHLHNAEELSISEPLE